MHDKDESQPRDFYDLLVDENEADFSDYVSISVSNDGQNTKVSVATADDQPTVYSITLDGVKASDLESILDTHKSAH